MPIPFGPCKRTGPVRPPSGTTVLIPVSESTVKPASTVLNLTDAMPVNLAPVSVTGVPGAPAAGAMESISGSEPNAFCQ